MTIPTVTEAWLNGWIRERDTVTIGLTKCCAGCGHATVAFSGIPDPPPNDQPPNWPFDHVDCPLCILRDAALENFFQIKTLEHHIEVLREAVNNLTPDAQRYRDLKGLMRKAGGQ